MRNAADERAVNRVVEWAERDEDWEGFRHEFFAEHFEPLLEELDLSDDELFERLGPSAEPALAAVVAGFFAARFGENGERNVVDEYLTRRGWLEKAGATRYLRAVRDSSPSLFEVVGVEPGRAVTVRDLIRESEPVRIADQDASDGLVPWDCLAARVVQPGRSPCFALGLLPLSREVAMLFRETFTRMAREFRRRLRAEARKKKEPIEVGEADVLEFLLRSPACPLLLTYLFVNWQVRNPAAGPPALQNTDGEALVPSTVRFPIHGAEAAVATALDDAPEFDRDGHEARWSWRGREMPPAPLSGEPAGGAPAVGVGYLSVGLAEIVDGALRLEVNSVERAERGRELLASRLGASLGSPLTSHEDPSRRLASSDDEGPPGPESLDIPPEVAEAVLGAHFQQHYRQVLDEPIPMLGDVSPRKAAKSRKGRAAVVEWLKGVENSELRQAAETGRKPFDTGWIWEELKIPRPGGKR